MLTKRRNSRPAPVEAVSSHSQLVKCKYLPTMFSSTSTMSTTQTATARKLPTRKTRAVHLLQLIASLSLLAALLVPHFLHCQITALALSPSDCARTHLGPQEQQSVRPPASGSRQQRQFTSNSINAPSPAPLLASDNQPEEFSLASQAQVQSIRGRSLGDEEAPKQMENQPPASSYTVAEPINQPAQVLQTPPMPTTSSSIPKAAEPLAASHRPEESSNLTTTTTSTSVSQQLTGRELIEATYRQQQQREASTRDLAQQRLNSASQPMSSSPSSISIITPILGHTNQHAASITPTDPSMNNSSQHQALGTDQPSMMRPIVVLGNPLSERDYSPTGDQQTSTAPTDAAPHQNNQLSPSQYNGPQKEPKLIDEQQRLSQSPEVGDNSQGDLQRMSGPPLYYSDGRLSLAINQVNSSASSAGASPRLLTSGQATTVLANTPRRPSLPPAVNQANAVSGFRSPMSPSGPLLATSSQLNSGLQAPVNGAGSLMGPPSFYQTAAPYTGINLYDAGTVQQLQQLAAAQQQLQQQQAQLPHQQQQQQSILVYNKPGYMLTQSNQVGGSQVPNQISTAQPQVPRPLPSSVNGPPTGAYSGRRPLNITRVEHISAECSNDLIRALIVFNGTFKGIIYSSGYVSDPTCLYVNGTGSTRYEFSIHLNQCGTLGRQQLHAPSIPGEARRRDQVMWNTLSIQYNSIIEQEWDEHFKVSCEYGSDFWKTVSFSPFNVETNTGSPVVFTINPPQCQMDVLLGHGMGPKIAVDGPVTVGDPLTLLIHMKSEKAGYDILVKNCVAHNGGKQRMQLIDSNGCVVNERFISPFRGTYNDNDLRHVTLYAYLKAFRFTGSPVLYLECEIHMCQSACPPQMCYWRRLSKRSVSEFDYEYTTNTSLAGFNSTSLSGLDEQPPAPIISDSLNLFKALQVRHESENSRSGRSSKHEPLNEVFGRDEEASLVCYRHAEVSIFLMTMLSLLALVITIAVTCCLRVRKLTRSQYEHNRLLTGSGPASPSLLSMSDNNSSIIVAPKSSRLWPPQPPVKPQPPTKPAGVYLQRQRQAPLSSSYHPRLAYLYLQSLGN